MAKLAVFNKQGKESGHIEVPDEIVGGRVKADIIHQAVVMYQASLRQGNAETKERADVSGGGKKPFRQKGTGRARAGSSRSPLWHGGGVIFGPHRRDFGYDLPQKIRKAALRESINARFKGQDLVCIEDLTEPLTKTKEFVEILKNLKLGTKVLTIVADQDEALMRVTRNIPFLSLIRVQDVNAYDVMRYKKVLITKSAMQKILERVEK